MKKTNRFLLAIILLTIILIPNFSNAAKVHVDKVKSAKAKTITTSSAVLKWKKVKGAKGYTIYIFNNSTKKFQEYKSTKKTTLKVKKLNSAEKYQFRIKAYKKVKGKKYYGKYSEKVKFGTKPTGTRNLKAKTRTDTTITMTWDKVARASGYEVYIRNTKTGKYEFYADKKKNSIKITKLQSATTYKVRVRAYKKVNGVKRYGVYSEKVKAITTPSKVKNLKIENINTDKVTLKWKKVDRAKGYYLYEYNLKNDKWKLYKDTKNTNIQISSLEKEEYYKFKVVAYVVYNNKKYFSPDSNIVENGDIATETPGIKVISYSSKSITIKWNKLIGATGYEVYLYRQASQRYKLYNETTETSMKITDLDPAKFYKLYVKSYSIENNKRVYGKSTDVISQKTKSDSSSIGGVDVASFQGTVDWSAAKKAGVDFAIIRCGYGRNRKSQDDSYFEKNIAECEKLNIPYGVYIYSYALDKDGAKSEANHALRLLKGHNPEYGVWIDMEDADGYKAKNGMPSNSTLVDICKTFCDKMIKNGYDTGIYASLSWLNNQLNSTKLDKYSKWVAHWTDKCGYEKPFKMWQYSSKGLVAGISGNVDLNVLYLD